MRILLVFFLLLTNCTSKQKTLTEGRSILTVNEKNEQISIFVPEKPQRLALLDYVALDLILTLGLEDKIVGIPQSSLPYYLKEMITRTNIANLGGLKEIDMEKLMSLQPDIIFTSGRTRSRYKEFTPIAPTVNSSINYEAGTFQSFKELSLRSAAIFDKTNEVNNIILEYEKRLNKLVEKVKGKTAIVAIMIGGSLKTLGENSRASIISKEIGFDNLAKDINSTHGNTSSYELLVQLNPDYIFVIDKDTAISSKNSISAKQLIDNELIHRTRAYQNDNIVFLNPSVWYLSEGGLTAMDLMLEDIENAFVEK